MKSVGFIGLGTMGLPMAANLIKKGFQVTVYNRTASKTEELARLGAETVATPAEAARSVDVLITMLSDDDSINQIFYGVNGIMNGIRPGLSVIDCSTISPDLSIQLSRDLGRHYVDFLDAPVTGSKPAAIGGTLLFMAGGKAEVLDEQRDVLMAMGNNIIHVGPNGAGSYSKLAHNTIVGINMVGLVEGLSIAAKAGIDLEQFLEIVRSGGAYSRAAELKSGKIVERDFSPQFSLQLMLKDLVLSAGLSDRMKLPTPMLDAAKSVFQVGSGKGFGEEDMSSVLKCYEEWMCLQVTKKPKEMKIIPEGQKPTPDSNRRRSTRVPMDIKLQLSIYQWEQEGSFSGQNIPGTLYDLSDSGLQIASKFPLARDMFIIIHFPQDADLPPIAGKIIRIETKDVEFRYGCLLSGVPPYVQIKLEEYIKMHLKKKGIS